LEKSDGAGLKENSMFERKARKKKKQLREKAEGAGKDNEGPDPGPKRSSLRIAGS